MSHPPSKQDIDFSFSPNQFDFEEVFFRKLVAQTLSQLSIEQPVQLSLELVSNQKMAAINRRYRGKSGATDVISFALEEGDVALPENWPVRVLGDIFLAPRYIAKMAQSGNPENRQSTEQAMAFIFVHGLLHLLGYDHPDDKAAAEMDALTQTILDTATVKSGAK